MKPFMSNKETTETLVTRVAEVPKIPNLASVTDYVTIPHVPRHALETGLLTNIPVTNQALIPNIPVTNQALVTNVSETKQATKADTKTKTDDAWWEDNVTVTKPQSQNEKKGSKKKDKQLTLRSTVKTLAIKVYDEQIPDGWNALIDTIRETDVDLYQILAIIHDRDYAGDDFWEPSIEKQHYHIIVRVMDGENKVSKNGTKVSTILNHLGIKFRKEDETLLKQHAIETTRDFASYAMYLTHETDAAIADGKHIYGIERIISNLDMEGILRVREGYIRPRDMAKPSNTEMIKLDMEAEELGRNLGNFDKWYHEQSLPVRSATKMKQVRESYMWGAKQRMEDNDYICRLCIFISGGADVGKSYTSMLALKNMGYNEIITIGGGGTGKYDTVLPSTQCLLVDDDTIPDPLNTTDNKMCYLYRRNSNNPIWAGKIIVVTSNKDFYHWARDCGCYTDEHINALRSRFYICNIETVHGKKRLNNISVSARGTAEQQEERYNDYIRFRDNFNKAICSYVKTDFDYSKINDYVQTRIKTIKKPYSGTACLKMLICEWDSNQRDFEEKNKICEYNTDIKESSPILNPEARVEYPRCMRLLSMEPEPNEIYCDES